MRILLIGHGRMGKLVETLARRARMRDRRDCRGRPRRWPASPRPPASVDVAIDFSQPTAVAGNLTALADRGMNVVIGTTGWQDQEREMREVAGRAGIGVLASANFSLGMHIFAVVAEEAARKFAGSGDVGAWIHEAHHAAKLDAPSGTALMLKRVMGTPAMRGRSTCRPRARDSFPGTHESASTGRPKRSR